MKHLLSSCSKAFSRMPSCVKLTGSAISSSSFKRTSLLVLYRQYAAMVIKTPTMADSITQGVLGAWEKKIGDYVARDEVIANIETDKITLPVNSPESGTLLEVFAQEGDTVTVGSDLFKLDVGAEPASSGAAAEASSKSEDTTAREAVQEKAPAQEAVVEAKKETPVESVKRPATTTITSVPSTVASFLSAGRDEKRVKMTPMRLRIAQKLKESQQVAASLTTFNEIDMSAVMDLRSTYKDDIMKKHNIKFGFMSAFVKASSVALMEIPQVNSRIEGNEIVTPNFVDISVAVATPKGLVTPVLRDCQKMSMIEVEKSLAALGDKARQGLITMDDLNGGTFTISNGGVFGSMMGTPIINYPQTAILGMHAIKDRAVVVNGQVVVRPVMYVALTYDHRIIDGREAVTFLVRLKQMLEDPRRLLIDL